MISYSTLLTSVSEAVRDETAWPDGSTKLAEQLRLIYVSLLAYMLQLDVSELPVTESDNLTKAAGLLEKATLPNNLFTFLPILGIRYVLLDGDRRESEQSLDYRVALSMAGQMLYGNTKGFVLQNDPVALWLLNTTDCKIGYVPLPVEPATGTYSEMNINLPKTHLQPLTELVSARIAGQISDTYAAQFHQLWLQIYGNDPDKRVRDQQEDTDG